MYDSLYPYIGLFIIGMVSSMAALGAGLGVFVTTRTLSNLLNKLSGVSQNKTTGTSAGAESEIQTSKATPCGQKCKHYVKNGTCKDNCALSAKLAELKNAVRANIKQIVSQKEHRPPEIDAQTEIQNHETEQQLGEGFLGGENDCYSYCRAYNETGNCYPSCPMISN